MVKFYLSVGRVSSSMLKIVDLYSAPNYGTVRLVRFGGEMQRAASPDKSLRVQAGLILSRLFGNKVQPR